MSAALQATITKMQTLQSHVPSASATVSSDQEGFAQKAGQLGIEVASINGALSDLADLNRKIVGDLQSVIEAVHRNSASNNKISAAVDRTRDVAGRAEEALGSSAGIIMETLSASVSLMQSLGQDVLQLSQSLQQVRSTVVQVLRASAEIQSISRATRLIAINAGVEAARAGQAGAGFGVIASSIKELSDKVGTVSADNAENLAQLQGRLGQLIEIATHSEATAQTALSSSTQAQGASQKLQNLGESVKELNSVIAGLEAPMRVNAESVENVSTAVGSLSDYIRQGDRQLQKTRDTSEAVLSFSEDMMHFIVESGFKTRESGLIALCQQAAAALGNLFENAIANGRIARSAMFDTNYVPVPGSNPPQHMTAFTLLADELLTPFQEELLLINKDIKFCAAIDRNGYLPTHNKKYSQAQGDDPVWNAANCRNRRIFNDRTGLAAGRNRKSFLLQTYRRDMGGGVFVMMKDISAPIMVGGEHWGGFRMGV